MLTVRHEEPRKKSLVETLQCPVCYELPVPPVFGCQNGHIICNSCKGHVKHCAVCRAEKFNVRNVILEDILTSPALSCPFRDEGCRMPNMNGVDYTAHVKICDYRKIECHCKLGEEECHGELFRKDEYLEHMMDSHGSRPGRSIHLVKCDMVGPFSPTYFSYLGRQFLLMSCKEGTKFFTWVALDDAHSQNQFYVKIILRYYSGRNEFTFPSEMIPPQSLRDTPAQVLKSGHCLEFSTETVPGTMPPYVWPGYVEQDDEEGGFVWGYDVEIHQAQARNRYSSAPVKQRVSVNAQNLNRTGLATTVTPLTRGGVTMRVLPQQDNQNPGVVQNDEQGNMNGNANVFGNNLDDYDLIDEFLPGNVVPTELALAIMASLEDGLPDTNDAPSEPILIYGFEAINYVAPVDGVPVVNDVPTVDGVPVVNDVPTVDGVPVVNDVPTVDVAPSVVPANNQWRSLSDDEDSSDDEDEDDNVDEVVTDTSGRGTIRPAPAGNQSPQPTKMSRGVQSTGDSDIENDDDDIN